jgi:site-specific DNA-cytosine methylase
VNGGSVVNKVIAHLNTKNHVQWDILKVRSYSDPTNRARLFIVGTRRDITADTNLEDIRFEFPEPQFWGENIPTIRTLMLKDEEVPAMYWRDDPTTRVKHWPHNVWSDKMRVVARSTSSTYHNGWSMGPSSHPGTIQSMDSFANSQTTYNGGGRRPRLDWVDHNHNDVGPTRLAVPIEATRFTSMSDTYLAWISSHFKSCEPTIRRGGRAITLDEFVFLSVNNGIPMCTSYAVDSNAMTWLKRIKCREAEGCVLFQQC